MRRTSVSANRVHGFGRVMVQNVGRAVYRGGEAPSQTASSQTPQRCLGPLGCDERPINIGLKPNRPHDTYDGKMVWWARPAHHRHVNLGIRQRCRLISPRRRFARGSAWPRTSFGTHMITPEEGRQFMKSRQPLQLLVGMVLLACLVLAAGPAAAQKNRTS